MLTHHVHQRELKEAEYHYVTPLNLSANTNLARLNKAVRCLEFNGFCCCYSHGKHKLCIS